MRFRSKHIFETKGEQRTSLRKEADQKRMQKRIIQGLGILTLCAPLGAAINHIINIYSVPEVPVSLPKKPIQPQRPFPIQPTKKVTTEKQTIEKETKPSIQELDALFLKEYPVSYPHFWQLSEIPRIGYHIRLIKTVDPEWKKSFILDEMVQALHDIPLEYYVELSLPALFFKENDDLSIKHSSSLLRLLKSIPKQRNLTTFVRLFESQAFLLTLIAEAYIQKAKKEKDLLQKNIWIKRASSYLTKAERLFSTYQTTGKPKLQQLKQQSKKTGDKTPLRNYEKSIYTEPPSMSSMSIFQQTLLASVQFALSQVKERE